MIQVGRPSPDILVRSWQDLGKILAEILPRYCQELQDVLVRCHLFKRAMFPRKILLQNLIWPEKNLEGSQQKSTFLQIYIVRKFSVSKV